MTPKIPSIAPRNQPHSAAAGLLNRSERVRDRSGLRPGSGRYKRHFRDRVQNVQRAGKAACTGCVGRTWAAHGPHKNPVRAGYRVQIRPHAVRVCPGGVAACGITAGKISPGTVKKRPENSKKCRKMPKNPPERSKNRPFCTFCPVFYCFRAHFSLFPIDPADILPRPAHDRTALFQSVFSTCPRSGIFSRIFPRSGRFSTCPPSPGPV